MSNTWSAVHIETLDGCNGIQELLVKCQSTNRKQDAVCPQLWTWLQGQRWFVEADDVVGRDKLAPSPPAQVHAAQYTRCIFRERVSNFVDSSPVNSFTCLLEIIDGARKKFGSLKVEVATGSLCRS